MAAISLSARDIEERLHAVRSRLRWRLRLHAALYSLAALALGLAAALWLGRWYGRALLGAEVVALAIAVLAGVAVAAVWRRERRWDGEHVACWVDREAQLQQRLETFVALHDSQRRSPLFPVLLFQLLRSLSAGSAEHLVPWRLGKPLAAVVAATATLLLSWQTVESLSPPPRTATMMPPRAGESPRVGGDAGARTAGATGVASASRDAGDGDESGAGGEGAMAGSDNATDTLAAPAQAGRGQAGDRGHGGTGSGAASARHASAPSAGPARTGGRGPRETSGGTTADERLAALRSDTASHTVGQATGARGSMGSDAAQRIPQPARDATPAGGRTSEPAPRPPLAGSPSSLPDSGGGGGAGAGRAPDARGLYGTAPATERGTMRAAEAAEPIVVTLRSTSSVRRGSERQGARSTATGVETRSAVSAAAGSEAPPAPIEKPLLPPGYTDIARRLFHRGANP